MCLQIQILEETFIYKKSIPVPKILFSSPMWILLVKRIVGIHKDLMLQQLFREYWNANPAPFLDRWNQLFFLETLLAPLSTATYPSTSIFMRSILACRSLERKESTVCCFTNSYSVRWNCNIQIFLSELMTEPSCKNILTSSMNRQKLIDDRMIFQMPTIFH